MDSPLLRVLRTAEAVSASELPASTASAPAPAPAASQPPPAGFRPLAEELRELERQRMSEALDAAGGVQNRAAQLIAMPLRTFAGKVKLYGLAPRAGRTPR